MTDERIPAELRRVVTERAGFCCEYCLSQLRFSPDPFSIEHIVPRSRGGVTAAENLALACQGCNSRKYNVQAALDPVTGISAALYHPRLDRWQDHFAWSPDFTSIIGLTPIGRATVNRLILNRDGVVNLRRLLAEANRHPPTSSAPK